MFTRRDWLKQSGLAGLSLCAGMPRLLANAAAAAGGKGDGVLVVIFLKGGNDGLNTVVPLTDPLYAKYRPALRIRPDAAIRLTDAVGLHPALRALADVWEAGRLTVLQGVGYPNHSRSHFISTAVWHAAQPGAEPNRSDGWLGRALDPLQARCEQPLAFSLGSAETPEPLRARQTRTAVPPDVDPADARRLAILLRNEDQIVRETEQAVASLRRDAAAALAQLSQTRHRAGEGFPATRLGKHCEQACWLIGQGLATRVYYFEQDGYDTHASQASPHAALLGELGDALAAFDRRLREQGDHERVAVLVFSEFGRRVAENESEGTDHGAAGPVFVLGGRARGGIFGAQPNLERLEQGDVAVTTDFRSVYAALLGSVLNVDAASVLGATFAPVELFRRAGHSRGA